MQTDNLPVSRKEQIVIQELADEILIYDLRKNKVLCLNRISAVIWQECDGTKTVFEISQTTTRKTKEEVSPNIVLLALKEFQSNDLISNHNQFKNPFDKLSRRQIIKRIGFASTAVLPLLSTIAAPTAAFALSVVCGCSATVGTRAFSGGCVCTMNSDCCSSVCGGGGTTCTLTATNPAGAATCCNTGVCPPANGSNVPPGCGCNGNGNCLSNICFNGICRV